MLAHFGRGNPRKRGRSIKKQLVALNTDDALSDVAEEFEAQQGHQEGLEERDLLELKEMGEEIKNSNDSGREGMCSSNLV